MYIAWIERYLRVAVAPGMQRDPSDLPSRGRGEGTAEGDLPGARLDEADEDDCEGDRDDVFSPEDVDGPHCQREDDQFERGVHQELEGAPGGCEADPAPTA